MAKNVELATVLQDDPAKAYGWEERLLAAYRSGRKIEQIAKDLEVSRDYVLLRLNVLMLLGQVELRDQADAYPHMTEASLKKLMSFVAGSKLRPSSRRISEGMQLNRRIVKALMEVQRRRGRLPWTRMVKDLTHIELLTIADLVSQGVRRRDLIDLYKISMTSLETALRDLRDEGQLPSYEHRRPTWQRLADSRPAAASPPQGEG